MAKKKKKPTGEKPDWRQFEEAVARFITAIGGDAKVTHNAILPDAHTGKGRQRDVWVEWSVAGHFPSKALISCKYWKDPLDQGDIDHFNGEFISSKAQIGIVYARNGFYDDALVKAKALGFHCCKLYRNQPADLPAALVIDVFHLRPASTVRVDGRPPSNQFEYWKDLYGLRAGDTTVLDLIAEHAEKFQVLFRENNGWQMIRTGQDQKFSAQRDGQQTIEVLIHWFYRLYVAKIEYTMLDGSYNITANDFKGSQASPLIDLQSAHPGIGWWLAESIPEDLPANFVASFAIGDWRKMITAHGETRISTTNDPPICDNSAMPHSDEIVEVRISMPS